MKYTLICFTFNEIEGKLVLRNNWYEQSKDDDTLYELLASLGFAKSPIGTKWNGGKLVKLSGDFTLPNTRIIVHIIKNS